MNLSTHQLFSIPIWAALMPSFDSYQSRLLSVAYDIRKTEQNVTRSNINGYHSLSNHGNDFRLESLTRFILEVSKQAIAELEFDQEYVPVITDLWFNFNENRSHMNIDHIHDGILSGVFYLRSPKHSGELVIRNPGMNHLWKGLMTPKVKSNKYNKVAEQIEPIEGRLFIWPSYVPHSVIPNNHDDVRISISFNVDVIKR